jgi:hypothetical protein
MDDQSPTFCSWANSMLVVESFVLPKQRGDEQRRCIPSGCKTTAPRTAAIEGKAPNLEECAEKIAQSIVARTQESSQASEATLMQTTRDRAMDFSKETGDKASRNT